jgi:hypothetical protein
VVLAFVYLFAQLYPFRPVNTSSSRTAAAGGGCMLLGCGALAGGLAPGEVCIKIRGGSERFLAWSEKPLPRGVTVLVIESRGTRTVDVIEWADPLGESPRTPGLPLLRR